MAKRIGTAVGAPHQLVRLGAGLSRIEADYYALRQAEKPRHVKTSEERKAELRALCRRKSDMTAQKVANIRYLLEVRGMSTRQVADLYGLPIGRVYHLGQYATWPEVDPSPEGLDEKTT